MRGVEEGTKSGEDRGESEDHIRRFHIYLISERSTHFLAIKLGRSGPDSTHLCFQVSLDSRVREIINNNMVHPTAHTFDEAQTQIYTLMHRDSYPRFVGSGHYRKLLASYGECEEL